MGSCIGRCVPCTDRKLFICGLFRKQDKGPDFANLIEENSTVTNETKRHFLYRLLDKRKERKAPKKPVMELVEGIFNLPGDSYSRLKESQRLPSSSSCNSRDISLQCLDARALMGRTTTSTPASSLDLEWEHEALPPSLSQNPSSSWIMFSEENPDNEESGSRHAQGSNSDWSRVSSADSLEWDNVHNSFHSSPSASEVDHDTQLLLSEIERLTLEALKETGRNLNS